MLRKFLIDNRAELLDAAAQKASVVSASRPSTEAAERGLPKLYDHLIGELGRVSRGLPLTAPKDGDPSGNSAHGRELARLGYSLPQVVHGYGALCQAITELAREKSVPISAGEFHTLNISLDVAIADAATGFTESEGLADGEFARRMNLRLHDLRNALSSAILAHSMIVSGSVGARGGTNGMLERNLQRMRDILERSFSEVRMRREKPARP